MLAACLNEGFIGTLHDALAANVDPAAGGHLAVHRQPFGIQLVKVFPGCPVRHQVGVGDQHPRRVFMGFEYAHRLTGLHQQRFVALEVFQRLHDSVIAFPVARRASDAAIHHQLMRVFGDIRVEVIHEHTQRSFGQPALRI